MEVKKQEHMGFRLGQIVVIKTSTVPSIGVIECKSATENQKWDIPVLIIAFDSEYQPTATSSVNVNPRDILGQDVLRDLTIDEMDILCDDFYGK